MTLTDSVVVEIVRWRDFQCAGSELRIGVFVGDDRDVAVAQWQNHLFANEFLIAHIVRMHTDCHIAEQGFGAGGGDGDAVPGFAVAIFVGDGLCAVNERIVDMPHVTVDFNGFDFEVGYCCAEHRIPVHQSFATVDQAVFVQSYEDFGYGLGHFFVHGEILARPVNGGAHAASLLADDVARLFFPLPHFFRERFATEVMAIDALCGELAFDHNLRGNPRVIRARNPRSVFAAHTGVAHARIYHGLVERVSHVQRTGDVRRWQKNAVGLFVRVHRGFAVAALLPHRSPVRFNRCGFKGFSQCVEFRGV